MRVSIIEGSYSYDLISVTASEGLRLTFPNDAVRDDFLTGLRGEYAIEMPESNLYLSNDFIYRYDIKIILI